MPPGPDLEALGRRLEHRFDDPGLLALALAHRSWCAEHGDQPSNERLEFLGDAVLGLCVTDHIYRTYPDFSEGELAKLRAAVVNASALAETAVKYGLGAEFLLGNGEDLSGGREKQSILSDGFEAVIGAIYLDGGWESAQRFILGALGDHIVAAASNPGTQDYKTRLQELAARRFGCAPRYDVSDSGPDHRKSFTAQVLIGGESHGEGVGRSKKQAEQRAARDAWERLDAAETSPIGGSRKSTEFADTMPRRPDEKSDRDTEGESPDG